MNRDRLELEAAYKQLFDEVWTSAEQEVQGRAGLRVRVPRVIGARMQQSFMGRGDVQRYNPLKPSDRQLLAAAFRSEALPVAAALAEGFVEMLTGLDQAALKRLRQAEQLKAEAKSYETEEARTRNGELISFVAARIISVKHLLSPGGGLRPGSHGPGRAAPWEDLREEWNQTHSRRFASDRSMARQYYRAVKTSLGEAYAKTIDDVLHAEPLRELFRIDETGVEGLPETVFARTATGHGSRFAEDARRFLEEAQALRREGGRESRAEAFEGAADALIRAGKVQEWVAFGGSQLKRKPYRKPGAGKPEDAK